MEHSNTISNVAVRPLSGSFERILRKSQNALKSALVNELAMLGYENIKAPDGFVYASGELPVLLVAHLDTVHLRRVKTICYSKDKKIMMSPEGIGGDDRAGVYMILRIIQENRCHVLFCEDEETGGNGARKFANSRIRPEVNYIVEMDRRGANDAVFYNCDNPEFTDFVCGFGFEEAKGSFSDISVIAPRLGIAAVNISAGYFNEHRQHESIDLTAVEHNIARISEMVQTYSDCYEYTERHFYGRSWHQASFDDLALWGFNESTQEEIINLMPIPDSAVLRHGRQLLDSCSRYMLDIHGKIYNYVPDLDAAVLFENCRAVSSTGQPLKFKKSEAHQVTVLPMETVLEMLGVQ